MPLHKQHPVRFAPKGLSDAFDATEAFPGACRWLQNLVFDPSNPELVSCRPGVVKRTSFSGFNAPTFVTCYIAVANVLYGLVSSALNAGHDEPFAYDVSANTFITITGQTAANTPVSPPTSGPWVPPSIAIVGKKVIFAHAGFSGTGTNFFGVLDITTPSAPVWSASNLATNALPSVPTVVANLNNRAYFACANVAYFSDVLDPLTRTNASQSITFSDPTPIQAMTGLPVQTTSGGVVAALMIFKEFQIWQVSGDQALSTLQVNYLSLNVGTKAPRSVVQTPYGIYFASIDGPYCIDPVGALKPLTRDFKVTEQDIQAPFIYATEPSRMSAGYSGGVYRICMETILEGVNTIADYWFDIQRRRWNGPHTFPVDESCPVGNYFVVSHRSLGAALYSSQLVADKNSVFSDDGIQLGFKVESSTFPKDSTMTQKQVIESTMELGSSGLSSSYSITALNQQGIQLDTTTIVTENTGFTWGFAYWGSFIWSSSVNIPNVYTVEWTQPLNFQKMAIRVAGVAQNNINIGSFFARYQDLGYTNAG